MLRVDNPLNEGGIEHFVVQREGSDWDGLDLIVRRTR